MSDVEVDDERENVEEPQEDVEENAEGEDDDEDLDFDLSKKKKKKKAKKDVEEDEGEPTEDEASTDFGVDISKLTPYTESDRDYVYPELLKRIYDKIVEDKGALAMGGMKRHIEPPEVGRVGTKRIAWVNFMANCKSINRKPDHVLEFVLTELGTSGSTTGDNKLIIKGRFQSKQLENVLRKYIAEYVTCRTCKSPNTDLKKENRILFKVCRDCGATSSVTAIKGGFRAQTKRKKK